MHPNEALLRQSYEALERGDWKAVGNTLAGDFVPAVAGRNPLAGETRGRDANRRLRTGSRPGRGALVHRRAGLLKATTMQTDGRLAALLFAVRLSVPNLSEHPFRSVSGSCSPDGLYLNSYQLFERCAKDRNVISSRPCGSAKSCCPRASAILDRRRHSSAVEQLFRKSPVLCAVLP